MLSVPWLQSSDADIMPVLLYEHVFMHEASCVRVLALSLSQETSNLKRWDGGICSPHASAGDEGTWASWPQTIRGWGGGELQTESGEMWVSNGNGEKERKRKISNYRQWKIPSIRNEFELRERGEDAVDEQRWHGIDKLVGWKDVLVYVQVFSRYHVGLHWFNIFNLSISACSLCISRQLASIPLLNQWMLHDH